MILKETIKDKYLLFLFALSFLVLLFSVVFSAAQITDTDESLILHFDAYRGIDLWGKNIDIYGILGVNLAFLFINLILAEYLYRREMFLSYTLAFFSFVVTILILIAVSVIITVN